MFSLPVLAPPTALPLQKFPLDLGPLPFCDTSVFPSPQCDAESDLDERVSRARTYWVGSVTAYKINCSLKVFSAAEPPFAWRTWLRLSGLEFLEEEG